MNSFKLKTNKGYTLIDEEDAERIMALGAWRVHRSGYVFNRKRMGAGKSKDTSLHRTVMNAKPGQMVDHINRNKLDNRKSNLRFCTAQQNSWNKGRNKKPSKAKYTGVQQVAHNRWMAMTCHNNKRIYIGCFKSPEEAALAYNVKVKKLRKFFAVLNEIKR